MAEVFDGRDAEQRPVAYRPALTRAEKELVFAYLVAGHPVLSAQSTAEDELDPALPPHVPKQFRTDGVWAWPLSIAYYLDRHDITPPRGLLDHIRDRGYRTATAVADHAMAQAKSLVLGTAPESLEPVDAGDVVDLGVAAASTASRDRWKAVGACCGSRTAGGRSSASARAGAGMRRGSPKSCRPARTCSAAPPSTGDRVRRASDELLEDYECPFRPSPVDPPLAAFDGKRLGELAPGDEVDRFGTPEGNAVFVAGTTLPQRSAAPGSPGEYRRYRVLSPFQVVTATARPEHGQVGGGVAFVLPQPVRELVGPGWIAEL